MSAPKEHPELATFRQYEYEVDPIYIQRWSPRAFSEEAVSDEVLYKIFEAARWAPSAANWQPWRFIVARTEIERKDFHEFINPGNRLWCEKAPVLVLIMSKTTNDKGEAYGAHAFDAGTAWGFFAMEAARQGIFTHAMGGFDRTKAKALLGIPDEYQPHAVVALGHMGNVSTLTEALQEREKPSGRRPLRETFFEGRFGLPLR